MLTATQRPGHGQSGWDSKIEDEAEQYVSAKL